VNTFVNTFVEPFENAAGAVDFARVAPK